MRDLVDRLREQAEWHSDGHGPLHAEAAAEIERLRLVETDHKNVLKAALYNEPDGIDLVNRLTAYAISERSKV